MNNDWLIECWIYDCLPQTQDLAKYLNAEFSIRSAICPVSADEWIMIVSKYDE